MLSTWLTVLLLLEVQDKSSKNSDAEKVSKLISSLISSSKTSRSFSEFMSIMNFKTEDDVTWLQEHWEVNFFATIYDC